MVDENSVFDNSNLPDNWELKTIGEVAVINSGGSAPQGDHYYFGEFPFVRVSHLSTDSFNIMNCDHITTEAIRKYKLKKFPKGTIVFPKSGASIYLEKRAIISEDSYIVSHLCTMNAKSPKIDQMYLLYALKHHRFSADKSDGYPTLSLSEIRNTSIPLPPLPEQRAIANVLSTVRQAIDATERVIDAAREMKRSMMKHLFTYGPVPVQEADQVKLKESEIGEIPGDWNEVKLSMIIEFSKKPRDLSLSSLDRIPFISMDVIPTDGLYPEKYLEKSPDKISSGVYAEFGDILLAKITPSFENGKQAILLNIPNRFAYVTTEVFPFHPIDHSNVDVLYLFHNLKRQKVRKQIASKMEGTTGRKRVPKDVLIDYKIPLPDIRVQKEIVYAISVLDEKIKKELIGISALESAFNSLLHHLMTGKLRVHYE